MSERERERERERKKPTKNNERGSFLLGFVCGLGEDRLPDILLLFGRGTSCYSGVSHIRL